MADLVEVEGIAKRFGDRAAVQCVTLSLGSGDVHGFVGANGGGKTTTLRMLAGIQSPDSGRGRVLGFDLFREASEVRSRVGYMSQRLSLYADLSVFENLRFRAEVFGVRAPRAAALAAIDEFALDEHARAPSGSLSGGLARRLQLAAALIHEPRLVLLDEPTAGLDAISRQEVWRRIGRLAAHGVGVVVCTHDLGEAERCGRVSYFAEGRVVASGSPDEVARSAPAAAFLLSGAGVRALADRVEALPGVIASHSQGDALRVVAAIACESELLRLAETDAAQLDRVPMRLEDAALVLSSRNRGLGA